jgi:signal transduction histidine kinase
VDDQVLGHEPGPAEAPDGRDLPAALQRLLAVAPVEGALRRLVSTLAELVPEADAAALLVTRSGALEIAAAVGLDEATPERVASGLGAEVAVAAPAALEVRAAPGPPLPAGTRCGAAVRVGMGAPAALLLGSRTADALGPAALALLRVAADRAALALAPAAPAAAEPSGPEARGADEDTTSRRRAIDFILGIVGHDLRNPLGAIHMSAALLQKKGGLEGWQARAVDRMRSSTARMARIIADLLSYTRTRLGNGIPITIRPARLDEIARRAVDELASVNPDRAVTLDAEGDLAGEWDPDRLEQVVSNLVSNAIDHGDPGTPVRVEVSGEADRCLLVVRNRGPAVPDEVLQHLFEPFSRPPDERSRKGSGLGLGLFISREIVRGHGGDIGIASGPETVCTVTLPRRARPADA